MRTKDIAMINDTYPAEIHERFGEFRDGSTVDCWHDVSYPVEKFRNYVMLVLTVSKYRIEAYYFDKDFVWRRKEVSSVEELKCDPYVIYTPLRDEVTWTCHSNRPFLPGFIGKTPVNISWLHTVAKTLHVGDTFDEYIRRYNERGSIGEGNEKGFERLRDFYVKYDPEGLTGLHLPLSLLPADAENSESIDRFILKVCCPTVERETDNRDKNTFDFVRLRMSIPQKEVCPERKKFVKDNIKEICMIARRKIDQYKIYQRYGVPAKFLKLDRVMITAQSELELLFVLPEEKKESGKPADA